MCMGYFIPFPVAPVADSVVCLASSDRKFGLASGRRQHTVAALYLELQTRPVSVPAGATGQVDAGIARELLRAGFKVTAGDLPFLLPYRVAAHEKCIKPS